MLLFQYWTLAIQVGYNSECLLCTSILDIGQSHFNSLYSDNIGIRCQTRVSQIVKYQTNFNNIVTYRISKLVLNPIDNQNRHTLKGPAYIYLVSNSIPT